MRTWTCLTLLALALVACDDDSTQPALQTDQGPAPMADAAVNAPDAEVPLDAEPEADAEPDAALEPDAEIDAALPDFGPQPEAPPPTPSYSQGECPPLVFGSTRETSVNEGFVTAGGERRFRVLVPSDFDPEQTYPLVFAWHWLAGTSGQLVREGEIESAIDQWQFVVVAFDRRLNEDESNTYPFIWPFLEPEGAADEYVFVEDVLACVSSQIQIDPQRRYAMGVSAGALWLTHLMSTPLIDHFAAAVVVSGGLGQLAESWRMELEPRDHRYPTFVLWGGPRDWLGLSFHEASMRLRDTLLRFGHFVTTCTHDSGHGLPPITVEEGQTKFRMIWKFMADHTYGMAPGTSPYVEAGLPNLFEDWCEIPSADAP